MPPFPPPFLDDDNFSPSAFPSLHMPSLQHAHLGRGERSRAGGGNVVFSHGPGLTGLVVYSSSAALNGLYPATRFGTNDATTMTETLDALRESEWRWL